MYEFNIPDMSCGHCVGTVTQAIKSVDPAAVEAAMEAKAEVIEPAAVGNG